ncbi:hypothetical protein WJX74_006527 [Apatococcus lobatus]|uniref:Uncharacterized protein n=2 Tax=Apatococcus TaxID=904362 RepID=A0AAW1SLU0_9CHLO
MQQSQETIDEETESGGHLSQQLAALRFEQDNPWAISFFSAPRFHPKDPQVIGGLLGFWYHFKGSEADLHVLNSFHRALRCYVLPAGAGAATFRFFHEDEPPPGTPYTLREDGLFETQDIKSLDDPYFSTMMRPSQQELEHAGHACFCWRCLSIDDAFLIRLTCSLPPGPVGPHPTSPHPGLYDCLQLSGNNWGLQAILDDGVCRWTMGPRYSLSTLELESNVYTREQFVHVRPSSPIDINTMPFPDPRPRLEEDPQEWLPHMHQSGHLREVIWEEDGEMIDLGSRPTIWSPPAEDANHRLIRFEDSMYALYPVHLPSRQEQQSVPTLMNSVRIEVGGMMRHVNQFRRVVLRFKVNGILSGIRHECFPQPDSHMRRSHRTSFSVEVLCQRASSMGK